MQDSGRLGFGAQGRCKIQLRFSFRRNCRAHWQSEEGGSYLDDAAQAPLLSGVAVIIANLSNHIIILQLVFLVLLVQCVYLGRALELLDCQPECRMHPPFVVPESARAATECSGFRVSENSSLVFSVTVGLRLQEHQHSESRSGLGAGY